MKRWLLRGAMVVSAILLAGFAFVALRAHPVTDIVIFGGSRSAETRLPSGTVVRVEMSPLFLTHLAEYERRLSVCKNLWGPCAKKWLITDTGGGRQVNLYRREDGVLVVVDGRWMMEIDEAEPAIRIFDREEEMASRSRIARWNCRDETPGPKAASGEATSSIYFKDMKYLGMFEFFTGDDRLAGSVRFGTFRFVPSDAHGERLCGYPHRG